MYINTKEDSIHEKKKMFIPGIADAGGHAADTGIHAGGSQTVYGEVVKHQGYRLQQNQHQVEENFWDYELHRIL